MFPWNASVWQPSLWMLVSGVLCCALICLSVRRRQLNTNIEREHFFALTVLTHSFPDPVLVTDGRGCVIAASPAATEFLHYSESELLQLHVEQLMPSEFAAVHRNMRQRFMNREPGRAMQNEVSCLTKEGEKVPVETRVRTFRLDGHMYGLVSLHDISQFKNREAVLRTLSERDALTGLGNRRLFDSRFTVEWNRCQRTAQPLAVVIIDIDAFKQYNDSYGHQRGDQCLIHVALLLRSALRRSTDSLYRYGGEEFVCLIPGLGLSEAAQVGEHLRQRVEQMQIAHQTSPSAEWVTVSVGVASSVPQSSENRQALVEQADQALYQSKLQGRNRVTAIDQGAQQLDLYPADEQQRRGERAR